MLRLRSPRKNQVASSRQAWRLMRVLVNCENSARVRDAFRALGHDAWSCDILPTEGDPAWHVEGDAIEAAYGAQWDLMIAHPPCTYLTCAGNKWFKPEYAHRFPNRPQQREEAVAFVLRLAAAPIPRIAIENPIGTLSRRWRRPDQIIQPYEYGHPDRKPTCLWLKGLPKLTPTKLVQPNIKRNRNGRTASVHHDAALRLPPEERWKVRSMTYQGWADAMADQWGNPGEPLLL